MNNEPRAGFFSRSDVVRYLVIPIHTLAKTMKSNRFVKNRLSNSFGILFAIIMGFVLTEHVKNIVELIEINASYEIIMLSFSIFTFLLLSAFETFLHFESLSNRIEAKYITVKTIAYLSWFAQFIPFYAMTYILTKKQLTELVQCQTVSLSFSFIYLFYSISCTMDMIVSIRSGANKKKNFVRHIGIYLFFSLTYWIFYLCIGVVIENNVPIYLASLIILILTIYVYDWKDFYIRTLFEAQR